jgi:hypothetical protein
MVRGDLFGGGVNIAARPRLYSYFFEVAPTSHARTVGANQRDPLHPKIMRVCAPKTSSDCDAALESPKLAALCVLALPFRSKLRLEAENAALRH